MLYALIGLSLLTPLLVILAYRQGVRDGQAIHTKEPFRPLTRPLQRATEPPREQERLVKILANIENYDGSGKGQRRVDD